MRQLTELELQSVSGGLTLDAWDAAGKLAALGTIIGVVAGPVYAIATKKTLELLWAAPVYGTLGSATGAALGAILTVPFSFVAYQFGVEIKW